MDDMIIKLLLTAMTSVLTVFIIPWVKAHTSAENQTKITSVVDTFVQTAEQLYGPGTGPDKLKAVQQWLDDKGINVDVGDIEAAVLRLHAAGHDWVTAHAQDATSIKSVNLPAPAKAAQAARESVSTGSAV